MSLYKMHDEKETEVCFWSRPLNTKVTRPSLSSAIQGEMTNDWLYSSNKSVAIGPGNSQAIYSVKLIIFGSQVFLPEFTDTTSSSSFFTVGFYFFLKIYELRVLLLTFCFWWDRDVDNCCEKRRIELWFQLVFIPRLFFIKIFASNQNNNPNQLLRLSFEV